MKKVVIIGAGLAGLSAGIRLQKSGYQVEIYEKELLPGGKMHQIKDRGFTFDVGPTIVMMPEVYRSLFRDAGVDPDEYIPMERIEPMYDVYFKDETYRHYEIKSDLVSLIKMAESKSMTDSAGLLLYLSDIYKRYQIALKDFISRPFRSKFDFYNPYMINQALKLKTLGSADKMMAKYIKNKDIQQMLSFQTLYIGVSPKKGPSLYNIIPMVELLYGVWFIKGGMHTMASSCARLFESLGGLIHYGQEVSSIMTEHHQITGIRLPNKLVEADYVICNADFPYAMKQLVKDKQIKGKYKDKKIDKLKYSCSCLIFYWGVKGDFPNLNTHNFIISEDLDGNLSSIFDGSIIEDPSIYLHIPTKLDKTLAPDGHQTFYVLIPVSELSTATYPYDNTQIDYYKTKAIEALKQLPDLADIEENIVLEHIFTPNDFDLRFNAYNGATFGLQPTLTQSNHFRPQSKSRNCDGLYFTGSSTHPGAGVPIVIEGGRIAAEELRRDNKEDIFK